MNQDLITNIAIQLLPLTVACAVALYRLLSGYLQSKLPAEQQRQLLTMHHTLASIADTVVSAVEQSMPGEQPEAKKYQAIRLVAMTLSQFGVKLPNDVISAAIEAAVFVMNQNTSEDFQSLPQSTSLAPKPILLPVSNQVSQSTSQNSQSNQDPSQ